MYFKQKIPLNESLFLFFGIKITYRSLKRCVSLLTLNIMNLYTHLSLEVRELAATEQYPHHVFLQVVVSIKAV